MTRHSLYLLAPALVTALGLAGCELNFGKPDTADTGSWVEGDADADADADTDTDADADSDADADTDADADADTDADADADSDADTDCEWLDVEVDGSNEPDPATQFDLTYFGLGFIGQIQESEIYDWEMDSEPASAMLEFTLYDSDWDTCSLIYDASDYVHNNGWKTEGGQLYDAFDIDIAAGYTDCPELDDAQWETIDARELVERHKWGHGFGSFYANESELKDAVQDAGLDWTNDWQPYVMATYIYWDLAGYGIELGYGFGYESECGVLTTDGDGYATTMAAATGTPLPSGVYSGSPFYVYDATYLLH